VLVRCTNLKSVAEVVDRFFNAHRLSLVCATRARTVVGEHVTHDVVSFNVSVVDGVYYT
jgi:hypothetical protein